MENFKPTKYTLKCVATSREFSDEGWILDDSECKAPSLVRAQYEKKQLEVRSDDYGFYKFCDWLPVKRMLKGSSERNVRPSTPINSQKRKFKINL